MKLTSGNLNIELLEAFLVDSGCTSRFRVSRARECFFFPCSFVGLPAIALCLQRLKFLRSTNFANVADAAEVARILKRKRAGGSEGRISDDFWSLSMKMNEFPRRSRYATAKKPFLIGKWTIFRVFSGTFMKMNAFQGKR